PRRGDMRRERERRSKMNFPPRPFMLRPVRPTLYDVIVTVGVAVIADTGYHATEDLSVSAIVLFPFIFFYWRRGDVREIADRTLRVIPRARSTAMGIFEYLAIIGTVAGFFGVNSLGRHWQLAIYASWTVIVVQYLRYRHRVLAPFRDVRLAWWQRDEYMACFALLVWIVFVDMDSTHFIEVYYNNRFIEALVR
ncbi:MAG: hypothetical protein EBT54_03345, partial [Betaproteobacteria bacterium]|nr:hypothetical protein [Betaproteobacteria bacterium]